jgi:hypothetical protein
VDVEIDRERWAREQLGYGVVTLHALRRHVGPEKFDAALDAFGRANAGKRVTAADFLADLGKRTGADAAGFLADREPPPLMNTPAFTTLSFLDEPDACLIVYGTLDDEAANRAAADSLRELIRRRWSNVVVPVVADREADREQVRARHVLLVGRPSANRLTAEFLKGPGGFPVTFTAGAFAVGGTVYAHPDSAVVAAGANPRNRRYSAVVLAGLSAAATFHAPEFLLRDWTPAAEVLVCPANGKVRPVVVTGEK